MSINSIRATRRTSWGVRIDNGLVFRFSRCIVSLFRSRCHLENLEREGTIIIKAQRLIRKKSAAGSMWPPYIGTLS